jgi:hypothetical protein
MSTGYSGKPLAQKLGIKPGCRVLVLNPPPGYREALDPLPDGVEIADSLEGQFDCIHFFTAERAALEVAFPALKGGLATAGMLWISWPKKAARMPTDLDENIIREIGLRGRLVDVKVAAIDERWSGLKFVYRLKDR